MKKLIFIIIFTLPFYSMGQWYDQYIQMNNFFPNFTAEAGYNGYATFYVDEFEGMVYVELEGLEFFSTNTTSRKVCELNYNGTLPDMYLGSIESDNTPTSYQLFIKDKKLYIYSELNENINSISSNISASYINYTPIPQNMLEGTMFENYVKETEYLTVNGESGLKRTQITFYDGLGRPKQIKNHAQSATGKDIVTHIEYDSIGRQVKEYLPYVPTTAASQNYLSTALTDVGAFYNTPSYENTLNPYSEKILENSPLNRVLKQAASGNTWANGSGHEVKFDYQTNVANEVKLFVATSSGTNYATEGYYAPTLTQTTTYPENQLYKTITYDENTAATPIEGNGSTVEFKDKEGRVILKRVYGSSIIGSSEQYTTHDTYYVYDQYGNITFVIPPKVDTSVTISNDVLNNLCYQYRYDYRNRLVEKKLPGKQWEFIVYDKLDRVIATGPVFSPFSNLTTIGWMITKYDVFNRPILTGWMPSTTVTSAGRKALQNLRNADTILSETKTPTVTNTSVNGIAFRYSNVAFPNTTAYHVLSVNYYDDYNFPNAPATFPNVLTTQVVYYNNSTQKPKALPTGSWTRAVSTSSSPSGSTSYTLYDYKARPIRTYTKNHLNGFTQVDSFLDFTGKALYTVTTHNRSATTTATQTIQDNYAYTDQDRLLTHTQTINGIQPPQLIAENSYDELGQLISKKVGNTTSNPLQKVDYTYNIRGWLSEINKTGWNDSSNPYPLNVSGEPNDLFAFKINYNTVQNETFYTGEALYNGNISETYWRTSGDNVLRKYGYFYDDLNRLRNSVYQKPFTSAVVTNMYNESMSYDKNGNILGLQRNGDFDAQSGFIEIDILNYIYKLDALNNQTNQLARVDDASSPSNSTLGFKNGGNTDDDYSYDANGNMTIDKNKGITTAIKYNHLNLPIEIIFAPATPVKKINYLYSALGEKLQKTVTNGTSITITDYLGGFQYIKVGATALVLQYFPHPEGYVNFDSGVYKHVFCYKDHLGNVRVSYTKDNTTGLAVIMEQNHYYPFGLKHTNYNTNVLKLRGSNVEPALVNPYKYKYNGKELQDELGLNMYDYGARNYDPALGRWMNIDPLAEKYASLTPYDYVGGNPVIRIDPDGMDWYTDSDGNYHFNAGLNKDNAEQFFKDNNINNGTYKYASGNIRVGYNIGNEDEEILSNYTLNQDGSITDNMNNRNLNINETQSLGDTGKTIKAYEGETRMEQLDREVGEMNSFSRLLFNMFCYSDVSQTMALADLLDQNQAEGTSYGMYLTSQEGFISTAKMGANVKVGGNNLNQSNSSPGTASTQTTMGGSQRPDVPTQTVTVSGESKNVHTGPRGGKYYVNNDGNRVYLNRDGTKK